LYFCLLGDNANFSGKSIAEFLAYVRSSVRAPLTMIWDSIPIHRGEPVRQYVRCQRDVVLEMIPEYAPELNPADGVWSHVKYARLPNFTPHDLATLWIQLARELAALKHRPDLLLSFIRKSQLTIE
jgi:putative transposase